MRYFTTGAAQLDTLIDESGEPIDVWTTLRHRHAVAADRAIAATLKKRARRLVALDRDGAVRAMAAAAITSIPLQSRHSVAAPAGSAFSCSLSVGARIGHEADRHARRRAHHHRRLEPAQFDPHEPGPVTLREAFSRSINTSAPRSAPIGLRDHRRHGAPLRHQQQDFDLSLDGAGQQRSPAGRHDPRVRFGCQSRRRGLALCDSQGGDRGWPAALSAQRRRGARAGGAMGRGGNDRPAAIGSAHWNRPGGADRRPVAGKTGTTSSTRMVGS